MFTEEQRRKYETTRQMAKEEIDNFDRLLADEVRRSRQRIEELQEAKKAAKQIYDAACTLLGAKTA